MNNIAIKYQDIVKEKIRSIKINGVEKLHVISDFDRTLTYAYYNGQKRPSIISVLRDTNALSENYSERAHALYDKYHAIGDDPEVPRETRKKAMYDWWRTHFDLMIECGLRYDDIKKAAFSKKIELRDGALSFFDLLHDHNIPLIILSATGLGEEAVSLNLEKHKRLYDNIHIISNGFEYDETGKVIAVKEPIVHSLNKDETTLIHFPELKKEVERRDNIILLGDSLSDLDMTKGYTHKNVLSIGFLNDNLSNDLDRYMENYDIVITNDSSMEYLNDLIKSILTH